MENRKPRGNLKMKTEKVKLKKLSSLAKVPVYSSECAAGADLYAATADGVTIAPGDTVMIGTGIAAQIPDGLVGLVYARSGLATKRGIAPANKVGVIDSDYRGEIKVSLHNHSSEPQTIAAGERIAQLVIAPYIRADFEECDNLDETGRGAGGFGSTGTK